MTTSIATAFIAGAIVMGTLAVGLFFVRFWKVTRDRLFLLFGVAFFVEGLNRAAIAFSARPNEAHLSFYVVRLLSFALILVAIIGKNFSRRGP